MTPGCETPGFETPDACRAFNLQDMALKKPISISIPISIPKNQKIGCRVYSSAFERDFYETIKVAFVVKKMAYTKYTMQSRGIYDMRNIKIRCRCQENNRRV